MKHIALIGIDGSGKSSLAGQLQHYLTKTCNYKVLIATSNKMNSTVLKAIENKTGRKVSDELRLTAFAFDLAIKYQQVADMQELDFIIWDRYYYCLFAYFTALNTDLSSVREITTIMPVPDYTFFLEIDVETALDRIEQRGEPQKKEESYDYLKAVQREYIQIMKDSNAVTLNTGCPRDELLKVALKHILQVH
ncbi:deoxynucleoside kinase [Anaerocolumna sp. AGMB13020]|uniref:deoxynucleoside kinase n=1 Tax=Anaerocolumna sp. AGMB13020 TaxID=3081750 RepID=UPI002952DAC4|nr:deoxynucleoside kinase [Anaerocolumna sp. AGMB13020]WOO34826.1 deoxynucleoside kinase [Anaerocolumna sp. AGMB13020]